MCCYKIFLSCYYSFQEIHLNNGEAVVCQGHVEKHTTSDRTETEGRNVRWKRSIFYDADPGLEFLWWRAPRQLEQLWACVFQEKPFGTLQMTMELRTELETFKSWCASLQREDQPCVMSLITTLNPFHPMRKGNHCYRREGHWLRSGQREHSLMYTVAVTDGNPFKSMGLNGNLCHLRWMITVHLLLYWLGNFFKINVFFFWFLWLWKIKSKFQGFIVHFSRPVQPHFPPREMGIHRETGMWRTASGSDILKMQWTSSIFDQHQIDHINTGLWKM